MHADKIYVNERILKQFIMYSTLVNESCMVIPRYFFSHIYKGIWRHIVCILKYKGWKKA